MGTFEQFESCCAKIKKMLTKSSSLNMYLDLVNLESEKKLKDGCILEYNTIKYALSKIKEEVEEELGLDYTPLDDYLESHAPHFEDKSMEVSRKWVLKGINECIEENKDSGSIIASNVLDALVGDSCCILIVGNVEHYLKLVDKSAIMGHHFISINMDQAQLLGKHGLNVTFILESHIFAIMPKIDKILIHIHVLLADTSFVAITGASTICHAAKYFRKPVLITVPNHSICGKHSEQLAFTKQLQLIQPEQPSGIKSQFDIIQLDSIDILITSQGIYPSTYAYQLTREFARGFTNF